MEKRELEILAKHIENIILNKPITKVETTGCTQELVEFQDALAYLSDRVEELNEFSNNICKGNLDIPLPGRHNMLVGGLKEFHSVLRHLTWQTEQVARGDYKQRVSFLGEFSDSFNIMVEQLEEREQKLEEKSKALAQSMELMISIMDAHKDWIVVTDQETNEVIYNNRSHEANSKEFDAGFVRLNQSPIVKNHLQSTIENNERTSFIFQSMDDRRFYQICSYPLQWGERKALAHYISDVTSEELEKKKLSQIAYIDDLTGCYNRRYCMRSIDKMITEKERFSIVMVDMNDLKYVNDKFGHSDGDVYICDVVNVLKESVRDCDIVSRIGGDEFVLVLKNCDEETTALKMKDIFHKIVNIERNYQLSISYGIYHVDESNTLSTEELLKISDERMYEFKVDYKKSCNGSMKVEK